jgi:hypothetical protein
MNQMCPNKLDNDDSLLVDKQVDVDKEADVDKEVDVDKEADVDKEVDVDKDVNLSGYNFSEFWDSNKWYISAQLDNGHDISKYFFIQYAIKCESKNSYVHRLNEFLTIDKSFLVGASFMIVSLKNIENGDEFAIPYSLDHLEDFFPLFPEEICMSMTISVSSLMPHFAEVGTESRGYRMLVSDEDMSFPPLTWDIIHAENSGCVSDIRPHVWGWLHKYMQDVKEYEIHIKLYNHDMELIEYRGYADIVSNFVRWERKCIQQ